MQPKVPKKQIADALVDVVSDVPGGLRTAEVLKQIKQRIPGVQRFHRVILDYAEQMDSLVYKPVRGLFRHVKYRDQAQQEASPAQSPAEKIVEEKFYKPIRRMVGVDGGVHGGDMCWRGEI
jgi:hypothetical protein